MTLREVFQGTQGLRAGWRLLIFLIMYEALQLAVAGVVMPAVEHWKIDVPQGLDARAITGGYAITLISVLISTAIMARFERRRLRDYGLPGWNLLGRRFWEGVAFGFTGTTLLMLVICLAGGYSFGTLALRDGALVKASALWMLASLMIGLQEELLFRGYCQFTLAKGVGFWPAAFLISSCFGAAHFFLRPYERWTDWAYTGFGGLLFCLTLRRTGDLRFAIGSHAASDFAGLFVYSCPIGGQFARDRLLTASFHGPDWMTGGPTGPGASVFVFPWIALMFFAFDRLYRSPGAAFPSGRNLSSKKESAAWLTSWPWKT